MTATTTPSPEDELKTKQENLKKAQDNISVLQADIKALQTKIAEFQQATAGYEKFYKDAKDQKEKAEKKLDDQTKMATSIIGDTKAKAIDDEVDKKKKEFQEALEKQKTDVGLARTAFKTAKTASSDADDASKDKQAAYDVVKKQPKDTESSLKEVLNIIDQAEKAHDRNEHEQMYLLAQIAQKALISDMEIPTLDEYKAALTTAKNDADNKKQEAATKKTEADQKAAALTELSKNYDSDVASRQTDLLKKLKDIKP